MIMAIKQAVASVAVNQALAYLEKDPERNIEKLLNWIAWTIIAIFAFDWIMRIPFGNNYSGPI